MHKLFNTQTYVQKNSIQFTRFPSISTCYLNSNMSTSAQPSSAASAGSVGQKANVAGMPKTGVHSGKYELTKGEKVALRMWIAEKQSETDDPSVDRHYVANHESVLYCLEGTAELHIENQKLIISPGQSWMVPKSCNHTYRVIEGPFKALEATASPPTL